MHLDWNDKLQAKPIQRNKKKMDFIFKTKRKFGTIKINMRHLRHENLIYKILSKHGVNVEKLIVMRVHIDSLGAFAEIFNHTPNLKDVDVKMVVYSPGFRDLPLHHVLPDLKRLTKIVLFANDQQIIKCFRKAKVKTITISENIYSNYVGLLVDFLSYQDMLTSLTVESCTSPQSVLVEMGKLNTIPFRLTKLTARVSANRELPQDHDSFLRFINSQTNSLKQLKIAGNMPDKIYESVGAMTTLDTLSVSVNTIPEDIDFYAQFKPMNSVRTLEILGFIEADDDVTFIQNFLEKFPNIRGLILPDSTVSINKKILIMAQSLSDLESLVIGAVDENLLDLLDRLTFPKLKMLHIKKFFGKMDWNEFRKTHTRLVEFTVEEEEEKKEKEKEEEEEKEDEEDQIAISVDLQKRAGSVEDKFCMGLFSFNI